MQDKKWEFLLAQSVYIFPSSNANDGGEVNKEKNLAEITNKLIQKNFVIRRDREAQPEPLFVTKASATKVNITPGECVIEGYYINLTSEDQYLCQLDLSELINPDKLSDFLSEYKSYLLSYGTQSLSNPLGDEAKSLMDKDTFKEYKANMPRLHVIVKLLQNITGNVRGDITEAGGVRVCQGTAISVLTQDEFDDLDVPYLELAYAIPECHASDNNLVINLVFNDNSRYSYIHETSIFNDNDQTLEEWVEEYVSYQLRHLDTITYYKTETIGGKSVTYKYLEITVRNGIPKVIHYLTPTDPVSYDPDTGEVIVTADTGYNANYDIDDIQRRTHPVSKNSTPHDAEDSLAHSIDSTDTGAGQINSDVITMELGQADGTVSNVTTRTTPNNNGKSLLISRGDHGHDLRYILRQAALVAKKNVQQIGTTISIYGGAFFSARPRRSGETNPESYMARIGADTGDFSNLCFRTHNGIVWSAVEDPTKDKAYFDAIYDAKVASIAGGKETTSYFEVFTRQTVNSTLDPAVDGNTYQGHCALEVAGAIRGSRVYNAVWNDYAELYKKKDSREDIKPGTVICKVRDESTYTTSTYRNRKLVVGVCSDSYGHLLGGDENKTMEENLRMYVPVALSGRVYVNIVPGTHVIEGDLMAVSKVDGCAEPCEFTNEVVGTIVGKALETVNRYEGDEVDKVLIQVSLM